MAEYFRGIGSRKSYINEAFKLAGNPSQARVLEIGCGDGRDAKEIVKRANWYLGMDISKELIKLAQDYLPTVQFEVGDITNYELPQKLDIVFAFASLLHLNKNEVKEVLGRVHKSLNPGGIFYISLKYSHKYEKRIKNDRFGTRQFYFYNPEIISALAGANYETIHVLKETIGGTDWFEIALKKS